MSLPGIEALSVAVHVTAKSGVLGAAEDVAARSAINELTWFREREAAVQALIVAVGAEPGPLRGDLCKAFYALRDYPEIKP